MKATKKAAAFVTINANAKEMFAQVEDGALRKIELVEKLAKQIGKLEKVGKSARLSLAAVNNAESFEAWALIHLGVSSKQFFDAEEKAIKKEHKKAEKRADAALLARAKAAEAENAEGSDSQTN